MMDFLKRLIPKNVAGVLGVVQTVIPLARELIIVVIRIVAVFIPSWEKYIDSATQITHSIEEGFRKLKNFFL